MDMTKNEKFNLVLAKFTVFQMDAIAGKIDDDEYNVRMNAMLELLNDIELEE